eukprot:NODE_7776_length_1551_cov_6.915730.p1 GENE.NODE_7776_length_1551_cov_6.915730~~NODE_7776_length_1551_cov_6.915730.p1  ORF type:complete len:398 (-),score=108.03 NODE_7776_length_1551_cov_6.915730:356-1492(-)
MAVGPTDVWPSRAPVAYPGGRGVAFLRLHGDAAKAAAAGDRALQLRICGVATPLEFVPGGRRLHRTVARARILELERLSPVEAQKAEIRTLALEQNLASSETSFLAVVENTEMPPAHSSVDIELGTHLEVVACPSPMLASRLEEMVSMPRGCDETRRSCASSSGCKVGIAPESKASGVPSCCAGRGGGGHRDSMIRMQGSTLTRSPAEYDHFVKVLLIGDSGVGKTSLMLRYCDNTVPCPSAAALPTIGVDFSVKRVTCSTGERVKLTIWDTAGQERFRTITMSFFRGAHVIFVVYDVTSSKSFENARDWIDQARRQCAEDVQVVLLANKCDLEAVVPAEEAKDFARSVGVEFSEVSAQSALNLEEAFMGAVTRLLGS